MLTDADLIGRAGPAAFRRGQIYCTQGRVQIVQRTADLLQAQVRGTQIYTLALRRVGDVWQGACDCPAAEGGVFCKHLVAAVLTARDGGATAVEGDATADAAPQDDLLAFLRAQPATRLAGWLKTLAEEDRDIDKRLRLYRAAEQPETLKQALGKMLGAGSVLDYRGSQRYAARLGAVVEQLQAQCQRDAAAGRTLGEYVIGRLLTIYARSDDSAGSIGERLRDVATLHARACAAAPPGKALARPLLALQRKDEWDLLPLTAYWAALGADGQAEYGRLIQGDLEKLPPVPTEASRYGEAFGIRRRAEAYARASGDFELLQKVLRWELSQPYDHLRVLESLREYHREREALAWAEQAVKRFPRDERLRDALAGCLAAAGFDTEALEQCWQRFVLHPNTTGWDALKRFAGRDWPGWRERALAEVATRERGDATLRVQLLLHDGDAAAALALAREHPVWPDMLYRIARQLERDDPATAGAFYLRLAAQQMNDLGYAQYPTLVALLRDAARLLPNAELQPVLNRVRGEHGKKTRLMTLLRDVGL